MVNIQLPKPGQISLAVDITQPGTWEDSGAA
jgi:hypothetical protein